MYRLPPAPESWSRSDLRVRLGMTRREAWDTIDRPTHAPRERTGGCYIVPTRVVSA